MPSHSMSDAGLNSDGRIPWELREPDRRRSSWPLLAIFLILICISPARAQVSASISGVVTDPSGAAVPSTSVTAKNLETGVLRSSLTDNVGHYLILSLPVGEYEVRASKTGFQDSTRTGIQMNLNQEATIDLRLQVSSVKAAVSVTEDAPIVSTTTSDISGLVGAKEIKQLPLNGRSYDLLLTLNPGHREFHFAKDGRHRHLQFHHRQQLLGLRKSSTAEYFSSEWRGVHRSGGKQHDSRRCKRNAAGRRRGSRVQRPA